MLDDDRDALAAEYVLGTLSAEERGQAEALITIDPGFAEIVRVWERRLGELNVMVEAVEPPADLWNKIKAQIGGGKEPIPPAIAETAPRTAPEPTAEIARPQSELQLPPEPAQDLTPDLTPDVTPDLAKEFDALLRQDLEDKSTTAALASSLLPPEPPAAATTSPAAPAVAPAAPKTERSADVVYLARKAQRLQVIAGAMGAIAALLAVFIAVDRLAPGLFSRGRPAPAVATAPPRSRFVAVLQQEPTAPAFLLSVDPQGRTMTVRRMTAAADTGRSYELWLIADKNRSPQSLGLVGAEEFTARPLPANFDVEAMRRASYAVSLEPAGGAPHGVPTGPILFTGKMVESLPGAPS